MPKTFPDDTARKFFELACEAAGFKHPWEALSDDQKARYASGGEAFARFLIPPAPALEAPAGPPEAPQAAPTPSSP
jgi:hypothetical protein